MVCQEASVDFTQNDPYPLVLHWKTSPCTTLENTHTENVHEDFRCFIIYKDTVTLF